MTELRELANGRGDLLAEVAGIFEDASEGELNEPIARQCARLCRKAGADPEAIPAWIEEGRRRKANANRPPFSDPRRRRPGRPGGHVNRGRAHLASRAFRLTGRLHRMIRV